MSRRRAVTLAAMLLGTSVALAGGIEDYSAVTYNMQGSRTNAKDGARWTTDVTPLVNDGYDIIAVQEAGQPGGAFGNPEEIASRQCDDGATYKVTKYDWKSGQHQRHVYFLQNSQQMNVAFISKEAALPGKMRSDRGIAIICPQHDNTTRMETVRPILGIRMPNGSVFWTMHAGSYGKNHYNDADNIVSAVAKNGGDWAILGDFNRDPVQWKKYLEANNALTFGFVHSGKATHISKSELDFMVVPGSGISSNYKAEVANGKGSDHFPVRFGLTKKQ